MWLAFFKNTEKIHTELQFNLKSVPNNNTTDHLNNNIFNNNYRNINADIKKNTENYIVTKLYYILCLIRTDHNDNLHIKELKWKHSSKLNSNHKITNSLVDNNKINYLGSNIFNNYFISDNDKNTRCSKSCIVKDRIDDSGSLQIVSCKKTIYFKDVKNII